MNFAEKKEAYHQLQGQEHLEADKELLLKKSPKSPALRVGIINREKAQCEIVWALLDVASVEEIIANRPAPVKKLTIEEMKDITAETGKLAARVHKVKSLEEKAEIIAQIKELIKDFPEDMAVIMLKLPESIIPDFVKTAEFVEKLLVIDLATATQPELAAITRGLSITPIDFKAVTLRPILEDYRLNLPKEGAAISEEMIPVTAHLDVVNELTEEKDALKEELEEKEIENEDLQEQLEETTAELEEEKKSESSPDPV